VSRERVTIALPREPGTTRDAVLERARQRGFSRFLDPGSPPVAPGPEEEVVRQVDRRLLAAAPGGADVPITPVADAADLDRLLRAVRPDGVVAIEWTGDRVIPLENAIAARGPGLAVWVYARTPSEVPGALGALEHGADRVLVTVASPEDVDALEQLIEGPIAARLDWVTARVSSVRPTGIGDRVLVDTTSLLRPEEGMLVGSAAAFLFHVASEAVGSRFSHPRPFRVNAGAAHSYVLLPDGSTRYLSELAAGDPVLVARPEGTVRSVRVGRIKIERRPLVMVTADDGGVARTVFVQEAETVRLSSEVGRVASTELATGVRIRGVRLPPARHLGHAVDETIEER